MAKWFLINKLMKAAGGGTAVIPCFNEATTIGKLVLELMAIVPQVIVVDDGSVDETARVAQIAGATVVRHKHNAGKGAAIRTGIEAAMKLGYPWAVVLDGDGQHKPADVPLLIQCARCTGASLVVGNRLHNRQAIPWFRRQVNQVMSRLLSIRLGDYLPDTQSGFRWIDLCAWQTLTLESNHYEIESEMLAKFIFARHRVEFVPIQVVGRGGKSHIRPLKDTWRWLKWWFSLRDESLLNHRTVSRPTISYSKDI